MALWVNEGLLDKTRAALGVDLQEQFTLRLFSNPVSVGPTSVRGDFVEVTIPGYAALALSPSAWTVSVAAGLASAQYPPVVFTFTSASPGAQVCGYLVTNERTGRCAFAETFPTPFSVPEGGGSISVALTWYDQNG